LVITNTVSPDCLAVDDEAPFELNVRECSYGATKLQPAGSCGPNAAPMKTLSISSLDSPLKEEI
jgi:hypothetical protein